MPNVNFSLQVASRFLSLRNAFQGLVRWILALRNLQALSSSLTPALPPPPLVPSLDAPSAFSGFQDEFFSPYVSSASSASSASAVSAASAVSVSSAEIIAIESPSSLFSSPISAFQSSLMLLTPNDNKLVPDHTISIFILLAIISMFLGVLSVFCLINTAKLSSAFTRTSKVFAQIFRTHPIPYIVPACIPPMLSPFQLVTFLVSLLILRTGPVRDHLSSHMTSLTRFVAHLPVASHPGLDHVDSCQCPNPEFGMSIFLRVYCEEKFSP